MIVGLLYRGLPIRATSDLVPSEVLTAICLKNGDLDLRNEQELLAFAHFVQPLL
jgi:hypothetical protein